MGFPLSNQPPSNPFNNITLQSQQNPFSDITLQSQRNNVGTNRTTPSTSLVSNEQKLLEVTGEASQNLENISDGSKAILQRANNLSSSTFSPSGISFDRVNSRGVISQATQRLAAPVISTLQSIQNTNVGNAVSSNLGTVGKVVGGVSGVADIGVGVIQASQGNTYDASFSLVNGGAALATLNSTPVGLVATATIAAVHHGDQVTKEFGYKDERGNAETALQHVGTATSRAYRESRNLGVLPALAISETVGVSQAVSSLDTALKAFDMDVNEGIGNRLREAGSLLRNNNISGGTLIERIGENISNSAKEDKAELARDALNTSNNIRARARAVVGFFG